MLFTEHSMDVVFAYADRIIVLARGRLIADGDAAAIRDECDRCARWYFGTGKTFAKAGGMNETILSVDKLQRLVLAPRAFCSTWISRSGAARWWR